MKKFDVYGEIADLKDIEYKNTLGLVSIIELLIEKKVISKYDITKKARFLDGLTADELNLLHAKDDK